MNPGRLFFEIAYRIGFAPWDGHKLPSTLTAVVEGPARVPPGRALDVGCGTGDISIYLARHGWDVTAIDFATPALARARRKSAAAGVDVRFLQADATKLQAYDLGAGFTLVNDSGCMHGFTDEGRDAYVRALTAMVPSGGRLVLAAFQERKRRGPRGISQEEVVRRFSADWELLSATVHPDISNDPADPIASYDLRRR